MNEIAAIILRFWSLRRWMIIALAVAVLAGVVSVYKVEGSGLHKRGSIRGVATTEVLLDTERSALTNAGFDLSSLSDRAAIFMRFTDTDAVRQIIARNMGINPQQLSVNVFSQRNGGLPVQNPTVGERGDSISQELLQYRLEVFAQEGLPIMSFNAQAPNPAAAAKLADVAAKSTTQYLSTLNPTTVSDSVPKDIAGGAGAATALIQQLALGKIKFRQLGAPEPRKVTIGGAGLGRGLLVGFLAFIVVATIIVFVSGLAAELRLRRYRGAAPASSFRSTPSA